MNLNAIKRDFCARPLAAGQNFLKFTTLFAVAAMLAGCPASNQAPSAAPPSPNKVIIRGSNTIGEELAPKLIEAFKLDHPGIEFDLETKATGYGLAAVREAECDIAAASRLPTKDEQQEATNLNAELAGTTIGSYGIALVVNQNNAVTNLTKEQVQDIFTGKITNWKDVGGADAPIHLYIRDAVSGTSLGFRELAMNNLAYAAGPKLNKSYTAIAQAVAQDENGIGYTGIQKPADGAKDISVGGVAPTAETINAGKYPYFRTLYFFTNKAHESAAAKDFVQYVISAKGQAVLAQLGFVPHP
jgi:phosphate transport system substrate-binding protein